MSNIIQRLRAMRRRHEHDYGGFECDGVTPINPDGPEAAYVLEALVNAAASMGDDHQTSDRHHPDHVLVPKRAFVALQNALAKARGDA
jgi:hypothetical protein